MRKSFECNAYIRVRRDPKYSVVCCSVLKRGLMYLFLQRSVQIVVTDFVLGMSYRAKIALKPRQVRRPLIQCLEQFEYLGYNFVHCCFSRLSFPLSSPLFQMFGTYYAFLLVCKQLQQSNLQSPEYAEAVME